MRRSSASTLPVIGIAALLLTSCVSTEAPPEPVEEPVVDQVGIEDPADAEPGPADAEPEPGLWDHRHVLLPDFELVPELGVWEVESPYAGQPGAEVRIGYEAGRNDALLLWSAGEDPLAQAYSLSRINTRTGQEHWRVELPEEMRERFTDLRATPLGEAYLWTDLGIIDLSTGEITDLPGRFNPYAVGYRHDHMYLWDEQGGTYGRYTLADLDRPVWTIPVDASPGELPGWIGGLVAGEHVGVFDGRALDLETGEILWSGRAGVQYRGLGGVLIETLDDDAGEIRVSRIDEASGEPVWTLELPSHFSHADHGVDGLSITSPSTSAFSFEPTYLVLNSFETETVVVVDIDDASTWELGGIVHPEACGLAAPGVIALHSTVRDPGKNFTDGCLVYDAATGEELFGLLSDWWTGVGISDTFVYSLSVFDDDILTAQFLQDGSTRWDLHLEGCTPVAAAGQLVCVARDGGSVIGIS